MTTLLLIRHGEHELGPDVLPGRTPGVRLSARGRAQAAALAGRLGHLPIAAVYCSPLERARQTAEPLATRLGLPIGAADALNEIDFGEWTGASFARLAPDPRWQAWNSCRSISAAPGGESMLAAQARIIAGLADLARSHAGEMIAAVCHGDVIRASLAHYLGLHLDLFQRIEVSLASVSIVALDGRTPRVLGINHVDGVLPCS